MDLELKNKYALITGGTHGIGRSIVLGLAQEGCNVAFFSRDKNKVSNMISEIKNYNIKSI